MGNLEINRLNKEKIIFLDIFLQEKEGLTFDPKFNSSLAHNLVKKLPAAVDKFSLRSAEIYQKNLLNLYQNENSSKSMKLYLKTPEKCWDKESFWYWQYLPKTSERWFLYISHPNDSNLQFIFQIITVNYDCNYNCKLTKPTPLYKKNF